MKFAFTALIAVTSLFMSTISCAWEFSTDATIQRIIMHEEGTGRDETVVEFNDGIKTLYCHIDNTEKNLTSLALSLYMTQKKVQVHCYEDSKSIGSFSAHKLHRLIAN